MSSTLSTASASVTESCQAVVRTLRVEQATSTGAAISSPARNCFCARRIAVSQPIRMGNPASGFQARS